MGWHFNLPSNFSYLFLEFICVQFQNLYLLPITVKFQWPVYYKVNSIINDYLIFQFQEAMEIWFNFVRVLESIWWQTETHFPNENYPNNMNRGNPASNGDYSPEQVRPISKHSLTHNFYNNFTKTFRKPRYSELKTDPLSWWAEFFLFQPVIFQRNAKT